MMLLRKNNVSHFVTLVTVEIRAAPSLYVLKTWCSKVLNSLTVIKLRNSIFFLDSIFVIILLFMQPDTIIHVNRGKIRKDVVILNISDFFSDCKNRNVFQYLQSILNFEATSSQETEACTRRAKSLGSYCSRKLFCNCQKNRR